MEQKNKGGRPTKTLSEKRKYQVLLRLNTMEYYTLLGKSREASISRTEFLRQLIINAEGLPIGSMLSASLHSTKN